MFCCCCCCFKGKNVIFLLYLRGYCYFIGIFLPFFVTSFSGSGHNIKEIWRTSHCRGIDGLLPLHSLFQALLQGPISYLQQWLTKQWHKQHGLHGPSTPHKSPSLFHGQHPQPSVTEHIWPIYHQLASGYQGLPASSCLSLKETNALDTHLVILLCVASIMPLFSFIWATFTSSYTSKINFFPTFSFQVLNVFNFS